MKSLKLVGLALMAVFALGAFAASASAEEGFLVGGTGTPKTATFLGGKAVFETSNKNITTCNKVDDSVVTFSNDKTATSMLNFLECKTLGFGIHSPADPAGTVLVPVNFLVFLDPKNAAGALIDEYGIAVEIVGTLQLTVEGVNIPIELRGTALGAILTSGKATLFNFELKGSGIAGEQAVTQGLQGATKLVHNLLSSVNKGAFELESEEITNGLIQFASSTELMDS